MGKGLSRGEGKLCPIEELDITLPLDSGTSARLGWSLEHLKRTALKLILVKQHFLTYLGQWDLCMLGVVVDARIPKLAVPRLQVERARCAPWSLWVFLRQGAHVMYEYMW